jgi:hypothetical protein
MPSATICGGCTFGENALPLSLSVVVTTSKLIIRSIFARPIQALLNDFDFFSASAEAHRDLLSLSAKTRILQLRSRQIDRRS